MERRSFLENTVFIWALIALFAKCYCQWIGSDNLLQDIKSNLKSSASSEVSNKWVPEKTFDNNPSLYPDFCDCCFGTGRFAGVFWQIDLGNIYLIHSIEVLSRADIEVQILKGGNSTRDEPDKNNIIQQISDYVYAVSNKSMTSISDGSELTSFQNSYRYYLPLDPPILFQHLRVQRTTVYYLILCEIRMFSKEPANLLQSIKDTVTVTVSSSLSEEARNKAIDGNPQYYPNLCDCCSMIDGDGRQSFWQIDLGKIYSISIIEVISRADVDSTENTDADKASIRSQYSDLTIAISNETINSFDNVLEVASHEHRFVALLNTPVEFRFLRVGRPSNDLITICEVKLLEPDINKCSRNSLRCDANARCEDIPGSYQCVCNPGYAGNGSHCEGKFEVKHTESLAQTHTKWIMQDHVYVYDGMPKFVDSASNGELLAAYCSYHNRSLSMVTAKSGILTVYFDADISRNTTRGFNGTYSVNRCQKLCDRMRNQQCDNKQCVCKEGYAGFPDCVVKVCNPGCFYNKQSDSCECLVSVSTFNITLYNISTFPWQQPKHIDFVTPGVGPKARYGHVLIHCDVDDVMYLFGGRSLADGLLNDIWTYDFIRNEWTEIAPESSSKPSPRYFHTATCDQTKKIVYVFGGIVQSEDDPTLYLASKEMWKFDLEKRRWSGPDQLVWVLPLAGHTMTLADEKLIIIGGISASDYFNENVYIINTNTYVWKWESYKSENITGAKPTGIYGHTAVFNRPSKTIYIYGGHIYKNHKLSMSNSLFTFDVSDYSWHFLPPASQSPPFRYFHTAVGFDEYMLVVGGLDGRHKTGQNFMLYKYTCNYWHFQNASTIESMEVLSHVAASVITYNNSLYMYGGICNGVAGNHLYRVQFTSDVCQLYTDRKCNVPGCSVAKFKDNTVTVCYSADQDVPKSFGTLEDDIPGKLCYSEWNRRTCTSIESCSECIAINPQFKTAPRLCHWCSSCFIGKCLYLNSTCNGTNDCNIIPNTNRNYIPSEPQTCLIDLCTASTCENCQSSDCVWTNQLYKSSVSGMAPFINFGDDNVWTCASKRMYEQHRSPIDTCPAMCNQLRKCTDCLSSKGAEGGSKECVWSVGLGECMAPAYVSLHCLGGTCGTILQGTRDKCPKQCAVYTKCSECRRVQGCGWCAYEGQNGRGVCMPGTKSGPDSPAKCMKQSSPPGEKITDVVDRTERNPTWAYAVCPPENECINDHHTCNTTTEDCTDKLDGFECRCKEGYRRAEEDDKQICKPVCHQECGKKGECVAPDQCKCHFGYVGNNCSTECDCNGHSMCESVEKRDKCLDCVNNTQGTRCENCKPMYAGDPKSKVYCMSCNEYCYSHSDICLFYLDEIKYGKEINKLVNNYPDTRSRDFIERFSKIQKEGPKQNNDTRCWDCNGNTEGPRCQKCKSGYFRLQEMSKNAPCIKCKCNGHSDTCDSESGLNCHCQNNTETRCGSDGKNEVKCHESQCAVCKEYFVGKPINGHQCYRTMTVNKDYCLDPATQAECTRGPNALMMGRTVLFAVHPKYVNVDIRVTIDIAIGEVDIYFSSRDDTFLVNVDQSTGYHDVKLDPSYPSYVTLDRRRRDLHVFPAMQNVVREVEAKSINTFITVHNSDTVLVIRKLSGRLVITLPNEKLNLKTTRFYMVFCSKGGGIRNVTFGNLYFRQDQPHIDLFVFFSVFFSCFFLFLAMCVLLWKTKQGFDARRSRQQRAREMLHMASRPFAKVLVHIDHPATPYNISPNLQLTPRKVSDRTPLLTNGQLQRTNLVTNFDVVPIATEPTEDGVAAVSTLVFQLPGGAFAPAQLCLGSTLISRSLGTGKNRRPMSNC